MKDLAPDIIRQRMVIEGTLKQPFKALDMVGYCREITEVLDMTSVSAPICSHDPEYGWCAYLHWKESGIHIYGWDERKPPFFSVDIYTCKPFKTEKAVEFTKNFFGDDLMDLEWTT